MNIAELLNKYAKQGDKFYSPLFGEIIYEFADEFIFTHTPDGKRFAFFKNGCQLGYDECVLFPRENQRDWEQWTTEREEFEVGDYVTIDYNGVVALSKIIRICKSTIVVNLLTKDSLNEISLLKNNIKCAKLNKYSADLLKPGQLVLVRDLDKSAWCLSIFSNKNNGFCETKYPYRCVNYATYAQCIPFNFETKQLLGTSDKPNDFYIF